MSKVSVAMGIYNCSETLSEAIDSILAQTFSDWELVMCDDGSTDSTATIARAYCEQYPEKMHLLSNEGNLGLNKTLNRCLEECHGEYIARMDGDDVSLPKRFEREVAFLDAHPEYAIVSAQMVYFDEDGEFGRSSGDGEPSLIAVGTSVPFCHAPAMIRREAYEAVGGYAEQANRLRVEDRDLWVRMYEVGFRGYNLPDHLYAMRDDRNAFHRRKLKYRFNSANVSFAAIKTFNLPKRYYLKACKPIVIGLLPTPVYKALHKWNLSRLMKH